MKEPIINSIMLYNTTENHKQPSDFLGRYHIHILCHAGISTVLYDAFHAGASE